MNAARFHLVRACVQPDEAFASLDAMALRLATLIADGDPPAVTLRHANLSRGDDADLPNGPCLAVRRGAARDGDLVAYVFIRPLQADALSRLLAALDRQGAAA